MRFPATPTVLALVMLAAVLPVTSVASTWRITVDGLGDAPTIQAGIDSAATGDSVLVEAGSYFEHIDFGGKDILLKSAAGPAVTVIDGSNQDGPVISFRDKESRAAVLEGFTIAGGRERGIRCSASPTIRGNYIVHNLSASRDARWGGAMYIGPGDDVASFPSPLVEDNLFFENESEHNGGAMFIVNATPVIRGNVFRGNRSGTDGGAIWFARSSEGSSFIEENTFVDNVAGDHGGALEINSRNPVYVRRNYFIRNLANGTDGPNGNGTGGALSIRSARQLSIENNTFVLNEGTGEDDLTGGTFLLSDPQTLVVRRNIIYGSVGGAIFCSSTTSIEIIFFDNIFWNNLPSLVSTGCIGQLDSSNLFVNPLLCDPQVGDFGLAENSPALGGELYIGATDVPGCGQRVPVHVATWGQLKARYGSE